MLFSLCETNAGLRALLCAFGLTAFQFVRIRLPFPTSFLSSLIFPFFLAPSSFSSVPTIPSVPCFALSLLRSSSLFCPFESLLLAPSPRRILSHLEPFTAEDVVDPSNERTNGRASSRSVCSVRQIRASIHRHRRIRESDQSIIGYELSLFLSFNGTKRKCLLWSNVSSIDLSKSIERLERWDGKIQIFGREKNKRRVGRTVCLEWRGGKRRVRSGEAAVAEGEAEKI